MNLFFFIFAIATPIILRVDLTHPVNIMNPSTVLGGGIDGHEQGSTKKMLSPKSIEKMLQAGLKPLSYRLRTELGVEAWHWNPTGKWSDEQHQRGYWTSSTKMGEPIQVSYGYRLPRRGDTLDEANNDGYSRLDDGNSKTFWKSNPYLTSHYTGESDEKHPQWVILDFGKKIWINAARLHWREPYAKKFRIQYANDGAIYFGNNQPWHDFPKGVFNDGHGSSELLDLGASRCVQFIRIVMTETANCRTDSLPSSDPRDHMGYALEEVEVGFLEKGIFQDRVIHRPDQKQTMVTVSSTDPWHQASDLDEKTEQPGVDLVATSLLANKQPILWSLPVLYDTPENAAGLVAYLRKRGYLMPHQRIELGEEPDGQHVDPKDFGELYCQVAEKVRSLFLKSGCCANVVGLFPTLADMPLHSSLLSQASSLQPMLGGPSFVTLDYQPKDTTYRFDHRLWIRPFLQQLRRHHREKDFQFLTFEWYPFDDLLLPAPELLLKQKGSLRRTMNMMWHGGVRKTMPLLITEYGYSVFSGEPEVKMEAALLNAEIVSEFLLAGGTAAYLYGYEPNTLECTMNNSWGNLMMLLEHERELIPLPTFYGAQMVTSLMKQQTEIFRVKTSQPDLAAYLFHQKNSLQWNFLIINKNPTKPYQLIFEHQSLINFFRNSTAEAHCSIALEAPGTVSSPTSLKRSLIEKISYCSKNYRWHADGVNGVALRNEPPQHEMVSAGAPIMIEPWSLTVLKIKKGSVNSQTQL